MSLTTPVCLEDFEEISKGRLARVVFDYYRGGANDEQTLRDNVLAFNRYRLRPKLLRHVSHCNLRTNLLGQDIAFPIAVAPTAMQCMAHRDGEAATAKAATSLGTGFVLSAYSTTSIEDAAAACLPYGHRYLQMTIYKDRDIVENFVTRAEKEGYKALIVTVDSPVLGRRLRDIRNKFVMPSHLRFANFDMNIQQTNAAKKHVEDSELSNVVTTRNDPSITWKQVDWLRTATSLPIVLKGILTADDARLAVEHNVDGIIVSNHGARQLDGVLATIDALSAVVDAVRGSNIEVYLDGGIRKGTDVIKALALGARAVFIGRPVIWGLAYDGEAGVRKVLEIIRDEFSIAMALSGCSSIADITPDLVIRNQQQHAKL